eukprot:3681453-Pyramimonas_sp.AAC.1
MSAWTRSPSPPSYRISSTHGWGLSTMAGPASGRRARARRRAPLGSPTHRQGAPSHGHLLALGDT